VIGCGLSYKPHPVLFARRSAREVQSSRAMLPDRFFGAARLLRTTRAYSLVRPVGWLLVLGAPAACLSISEPLSEPSVDVTGRATLPSGASAAGLTIAAISFDGACAFPPEPRTKPFKGASVVTDQSGAFRVRVPADSVGVHCVQLSAELDGARAVERKPAVARDQRPLATVRIDLALR
jgi:hypothetical protein